MQYSRVIVAALTLMLYTNVVASRTCVQAEPLAEVTAKKTPKKPTKEHSVESVSIQQLIDGYKQFRQHYFTGDQLYKDLQKGQNPKALVITCSDSRVDPAIVTNSNPGDLFVIRNVANLVPPCEDAQACYHGTSAALEFGVTALGITHIIVLGHSKCAGIRSLFEKVPGGSKRQKSFVEKWMELASPAYDLVKTNYPTAPLEKQAEQCAQYGVINSIQNLRTFTWIAEREAEKKLSLHGWYFDITEGKIHAYDQQAKAWQELV